MNNLDITLMEFWGQFEDRTRTPALRLPAFAGHAFIRDAAGRPVPPPFPYITYSLNEPDFRGTIMGTASVWDRRLGMPNFRGLTNHIAAQVKNAIPTVAGTILRMDNGVVKLERLPNFLVYPDWPDPDDPLIVRLMINFAITNFVVA